MAQVKHVWFDCDGTLYRPSPELEARRDNEIFKELARRTGRPLEVIAGEYPERVREHKTNTVAMSVYGLTPAEARDLYNSVDIVKYIDRDARLIETVRSILEQRILASIFTNNKRSKLLAILEKLGLHPDWFKFLMTAEEVAPKPSGEGYKEMIRRSECDPTDIIYVGDREEAEIMPARKEGMNTMHAWAKKTEVSVDDAHRTYHFKRLTVYEVNPVIAAICSVAPK